MTTKLMSGIIKWGGKAVLTNYYTKLNFIIGKCVRADP